MADVNKAAALSLRTRARPSPAEGRGGAPRRRPTDRGHEQGRVHDCQKRDACRRGGLGITRGRVHPSRGWRLAGFAPTCRRRYLPRALRGRGGRSAEAARRERRAWSSASLPDRASLPWRLLIRSRSRITVCRTRAVTTAMKAGSNPVVRRAEAALDRIDPRALLAVAVAASGILLLVLLSHLTFFGDDWDPLLFRRGFNLDVLLRPHAEHILLAPTLIYKGIQATIGMERLAPVCGRIHGVVPRERRAPVPLSARLAWATGLALAGVLPVLFMGTAWEVLLLPASINFTGSMAAGIGALLALERRDGRRMRLSASSSCLAGLLRARPLLRPGRGGVDDRGAPPVVSCLRHRRTTPALRGLVHRLGPHGTEPCFGPQPGPQPHRTCSTRSPPAPAPARNSEHREIWIGRPLLVLPRGCPLVLTGPLRKPLPRSLWSALAVLLSFWFLAALGSDHEREPNVSRYQYVGGFLLLMVLADLASGIRLRRPVVLAALGIGCLAVITNLVVLATTTGGCPTGPRGLAAGWRRSRSAAAVPTPASPSGRTTPTSRLLNSVEVGPYLSAVDAFGSPTYGARRPRRRLGGGPRRG